MALTGPGSKRILAGAYSVIPVTARTPVTATLNVTVTWMAQMEQILKDILEEDPLADIAYPVLMGCISIPAHIRMRSDVRYAICDV
jgi:predicted TIM-barrel enzyme